MNPPTQKQIWNAKRKTLLKAIEDYTKACNLEARKRPVYLKKDSDVAVDLMREAFEWFIRADRK